MNESNAGGAVGAVGPGGTGNPGCDNGAGCASRTGLEDSINNLSMDETEGAIGTGGTRVAKWAIGLGVLESPGDGLQDFIDYLNKNETEQAIGAGRVWVPEWAIRVAGTGKPRGASESGGIGNPGCTNGAGYVSRTGVDGLEDFIDNLSLNETIANETEQAIGTDGTEWDIVTPYSGPLFPAYSSKVSINHECHVTTAGRNRVKRTG